MKTRYNRFFESEDNPKWVTINLKDKIVTMEENLRLSDLKKSAGMSSLTTKFRKQRNKLLAPESQLAVLKSIQANKKRGHITFDIVTAPTHKKNAQVVNTKQLSANGKRGVYTMKIRILDFFKWADTYNIDDITKLTKKDFADILSVADIQVFCNCMSFHFQGMNYNIGLFDGSIFPTDIPPEYWNGYHNSDQLLCKHLQGFINNISFWINPMAQMIKSELKYI